MSFSRATACRPGSSSLSRRPSRCSRGTPPRRSRVSFSHTYRSSRSITAIPTGERVRNPSRTDWPTARRWLRSRAETRKHSVSPTRKDADTRRSASRARRSPCRRETTPLHPMPARQRSATAATRAGSRGIATSSAAERPTTSGAARPRSASACRVQPITTPSSERIAAASVDASRRSPGPAGVGASEASRADSMGAVLHTTMVLPVRPMRTAPGGRGPGRTARLPPAPDGEQHGRAGGGSDDIRARSLRR